MRRLLPGFLLAAAACTVAMAQDRPGLSEDLTTGAGRGGEAAGVRGERIPTPEIPKSEPRARDEDHGGRASNMGWLGLAGLIGLAGLAYNRNRR